MICGHLDPDLAVIADELLEPDELLHTGEQSESDLQAEPALRSGRPLDALDDAELDDDELVGDELDFEEAEVDLRERQRLTAGAQVAGLEAR
ncbi:MAG TPA: hypothetical protein VK605_07795, partial [Solirubrobacteraceae bacterium]|nr:hypothetical protein [Solirubrobacteraceae bacterium]